MSNHELEKSLESFYGIRVKLEDNPLLPVTDDEWDDVVGIIDWTLEYSWNEECLKDGMYKDKAELKNRKVFEYKAKGRMEDGKLVLDPPLTIRRIL